jgi:hypothetical protein
MRILTVLVGRMRERPRLLSRSSASHTSSLSPSGRSSRIAPPAFSYLQVAGAEGGGMVKCPLPDHDDAYASCQVDGEVEQG